MTDAILPMLLLKAESLDWALAHARALGDTDMFPRLIEYEAIQHDWDRVQAYLVKQNVLSWVTRPHRTMLVPKRKYGFRVGTQLDPLDFLLYTATVYEIGRHIEARRVAKRRSIVHSWRFDPAADGRMYDPTFNYGTFRDAARTDCESGDFSHVVLADISDFYSRIYHHRLENALAAACAPGTMHVKAIMRLLGGWTQTISYGIPIGPAASRLLAEISIADVDDILLSEGLRFVRYNDDYRIFVASQAEGYRTLALLATRLFDMHGHCLQQSKTEILTSEEYAGAHLHTDEDQEWTRFADRLSTLLEDIGLEGYGEIDPIDLTPEQDQQLQALNLIEMLREATQPAVPAYGRIAFLLRRLAKVNDARAIEIILPEIDKLYPIFDVFIVYLQSLHTLTRAEAHSIGERLLNMVFGPQGADSMVSALEYHRLWLLDLFAKSDQWNCAERLPSIYAQFPDQSTHRAAVLALGRAGNVAFFNAHRAYAMQWPDWERRAFLAAMSVAPVDGTRHWYRAQQGRVDPLEAALIAWATQSPFRDQAPAEYAPEPLLEEPDSVVETGLMSF